MLCVWDHRAKKNIFRTISKSSLIQVVSCKLGKTNILSVFVVYKGYHSSNNSIKTV
jgi:hypothetical protein